MEAGEMLDLQRVPPFEVRRRVAEATRKAVLAGVSIEEDGEGELRGGIWLGPLRQVVLGKDRQRGGCTRSVAFGGQWTHTRLHAAGYTQDARRQAGREEEGTLVHRHLTCPAWEWHRRAWLSPELRQAIRR